MSPNRTSISPIHALFSRLRELYVWVARRDYVVWSTMPEEKLPKHIFPLARSKDYFRIKVGPSSKALITTTALISNTLVTMAFVAALIIEIMQQFPVIIVVMSIMTFSVIAVMLWLARDWKVPRDPYTIYL